MKVMLGWTQDIGSKWVKMDVTIEPEDIRLLFIEADIPVEKVFALTTNETYSLQMNEAEKFLLVHQMRSAPDHFNTPENKAKLGEITARNKKILAEVAEREAPEGASPWT